MQSGAAISCKCCNLSLQSIVNKLLIELFYITAAGKHCFDLSGLVSAVGVTDIYSRQHMPEENVLLVVCNYTNYKNLQKKLSAKAVRPWKSETWQALCLHIQPKQQ